MKIICSIKIALSKSLRMFALYILTSSSFEGRKSFYFLMSDLFRLRYFGFLKESC